MADNVAANSGDGAGPSFATDFKAGDAHWPIGKVAWGTRDTNYNIVDLANGLPIQPGTGTTWKVDGSAVTQPVSGTFWQATQPVSGTVAVTGVATAANQATEITSLSAIASSVAGTLAVSGTFFQATQPVSAAALPLPTGASTAAKQPALGTAGSASADVLSVQGVASMTALKVDGSGVTQPVSGTFFQATQPVSAVSLPLPTGAATDVAQGSTTSGQTGGLVQAAVLTSVPTYVNGNTNPLTQNTSGELRVTLSKAGGTPSIGSPGDATAGQSALYVNAQLGIFNGTTWDRVRGTSGAINVIVTLPATATLTNVAGSATSVNVVASNTARKALTIYNDSTARVRLKFGATASATSFTYSIPAGAQWEMTVPFTGAMDGIWDVANGSARVTELT